LAKVALANGTGGVAIGDGASNATFANSVAIGAGSLNTAANQVQVGGRTISGVTAGAVSATSTEAVNGSQLFAVSGASNANTAAIAAIQAIDTTQNGQIAAIQVVDTTQTAQISAIQVVNTTQDMQISSIQTVNVTQGNQIASLQAADTAFGSRLDTLDDRVDRIDRRASAGTAMAIAMGSNSFLPGKSFNISGNVGTYRGAYAGAINFGALISDSVALNAGIGSNFNKGGSKLGARAGFTIGF